MGAAIATTMPSAFGAEMQKQQDRRTKAASGRPMTQAEIQRREIMDHQAREIGKLQARSQSGTTEHHERLAMEQGFLADAWSDRQQNPGRVRISGLKPLKGEWEVPAEGPWHVTPDDE